MLFTDIVGSTELRVHLGEEAADSLRRSHDRMLTEAISAHGGTVVKGLGDGLMATFESAADAVAGAVAIQQAVELRNRDAPQEALVVRVGLSVGDVASEGGDVFGVPVVESARLCDAAGGGEILTADLVRALARGRGDFVFEPTGEVQLKGIDAPISTCRVMWTPLIEPSAHGGSVPFPPGLTAATTAYVGRAALLDRLAQEWAAARAGECRTILLAGEPGVGKTRTAAEIARRAYADGALVLYGRCDEQLDLPYQPMVEALEHYVRHAAHPVLGRMPGELARLEPELVRAVPGIPPALESDPATEEYWLFESCASWLVSAAQDCAQGLVLVLDDLHWATKPTLHLVQHLVRTATDEAAPVLVLATYRDTDIDRAHPLAMVLGDLRRLPGVDRLPVDNLGNAEVLAFIEMVAGHDLDEPTRHLAEAVYAETEGNPFFVGEVLRHLIETGAVRRDHDRWVVHEPDHVVVPEGVRDVVGRRLSRLSPEANSVLSLASVLGRDFDVELLLAVVDVTEDGVLDALDQAVRARLVEETGSDNYRFAHALVRTTLYEELSATRRRRAHRRVADALEKLRAHDVRALAHHCIEAGPDGGDNQRAVRYTLAAAEESLAARAFADAEAGFRSALELVEEYAGDSAGDEAAALCGLGEALRDQGDPRYHRTLLDAGHAAVHVGDTPTLVRAVLANTRGVPSVVDDVDTELATLIEQALAAVGPEPGPDHARLLALLAKESAFTLPAAERMRLVTTVEDMARAIGDDLLGEVLVISAQAAVTLDWKPLLARSQAALALADSSGDPTRQVVARMYRVAALLTAGEMGTARRVTDDMLEIAEREGAPLTRWAARSVGVWPHLLEGRLDEAQRQADALLEMGMGLGQGDADQWWSTFTTAAAFQRGQHGSLVDAAALRAHQSPQSLIWKTTLGWCQAAAGQLDEANALLDDPAVTPPALLETAWPFLACHQVAETALCCNRPDVGREVASLLHPYQECWAHYYLGVTGPVTWGLGLAQVAAGEHDEAVRCLQSALDAATAQGARGLTPSIGTHLGLALLRRGGAEDRERAGGVLDRARDSAGELGGTGVIARIDELRGRPY